MLVIFIVSLIIVCLIAIIIIKEIRDKFNKSEQYAARHMERDYYDGMP